MSRPIDGQPLVQLDRVTATRPGSGSTFRDLTWTARDGECWAVVGPTAAGKSTFAELLMGRLIVTAGRVEWPLLSRLRAAGHAVTYPAEVMRLVAFKEESRLFSHGRHYYQERFNFSDPLDDPTLDTFLKTGTDADENEIAAVAERLGIGRLRNLSFLKLSNGQTRRARLAKALLAKLEWLLLDDPFMGLDASGRADLTKLLGTLVRDGTRVLLITRPDTVPDWITHRLELDRFEVVGIHHHTPGEAATLAPAIRLSTASDRESPGEPLIELNDVTIAYDGGPILDRVSWTVRAGERWALLGPNGSGKTTLLSLVCGDHPQAYAADVRLFGRRRGTGESIWDIKRQIGFVSPEFHLYFSEPLTAFRAAATGFFDVPVARPTTPEQDAAVRRLFDEFGIASLAERLFARLSAGEQRLVLVIRALVKEPPLLVLDEPFQGFDAATVTRVRDWLDTNLRLEQTLVFVSHRPDEIPRTVTRTLCLDAGRVVRSTD